MEDIRNLRLNADIIMQNKTKRKKIAIIIITMIMKTKHSYIFKTSKEKSSSIR